MKHAVISLIFLCSFTFNTQAASFKTEKWQTTNGAQVVFYQAMEVPMLDVRIAFAAGSAYDGKNFGLSSLTNRILDQGNGAFDVNQIAEKLADTGAQYESEVSRDMAILHLKSLVAEPALDNALEIFRLIISQPHFKQDAFNREKNQQLVVITQQQESPDEIANQLFFNKLYGEHPYAHPVNGTIDSIKKINNWQIHEFYKRYYVAKNAVIVLVGAISSEQAHSIADKLLQNLPAGQAADPIPKASPLSQEESVHFKFPSSQTILRLGQIGIEHTSPEYFPLMVGNYVLGGGVLVSRLSTEIREKNGLSYGIVSQFVPMPGNGPFLISLATKNSQAQQALAMTEQVLAQFLQQGPSEEELQAAKQYLAGSFSLTLASNSNIAGMLLRMAFYHLPDDYLDTYTAKIEAVKREDIKSAFDKLVSPKKMLLVTVGKM